MDALDLLAQDHQKVKELFEQAEQTFDQQHKKELFDQIDTELAIHAHIEESVFYPALEKHGELQDMVAEARNQHEEMEQLLLEIEDLATEETDFGPQLSDLMETVEQHVTQEEGEMFPKVRELFAPEELERLGKELESAKGKHKEAGKDDLQMA